MRKPVRFTLTLLLFIFLSASLASADLTTLTEGAQYGDALVLNGKGKLRYTWTLEDSLSERTLAEKREKEDSLAPGHFLVWTNNQSIDLTLAFSGVKVRLEEKSVAPKPGGKPHIRHWQSAYNGEKVDFLRLDGTGKNGLVKPMGAIRYKDILREDQLDPRYYGNAVQGIPVGDFLRGTAKEGALENVRITGEEMLDGVSCQVVEAEAANSDIAYTVWIAPERMYRPKKIEIRSNSGVTVARSAFRQYDGDVWFPDAVTVERYYYDQGGAPVLEDRLTLTMNDDFEVNRGVSDNLFALKFPKGLKVYDWRTGTSFTVE